VARILIVDDNETLREGAAAVVKKMGHDTHVAKSGGDGIKAYTQKAFDMVFSDYKMEGQDGLAVLSAIRALDPDAVVVIMTGFGTVQLAVEAMRNGAFDFIEKPFSPDLMRAKVTSGLAIREERRAKERAEGLRDAAMDDAKARFAPAPKNPAEVRRVCGLIGDSPRMHDVFRAIEKVAQASDATVFIHGESGTGKELVARAIHDHSPRKDAPFVTLNCAAIPATLLESELFGHEKGAFTGAIKRKLGRFELANGGTLFLDEIGDVPLEIQPKLLRALQERQFVRVGGEETVSVDVRIVSATHRDIEKMAKSGEFREDLFYRLHIVPIRLPPLRERANDVEILAEHFVKKLGPRTNPHVVGLSTSCLQTLRAYQWPGNVRELENVIEQALVFAESNVLGPEDLPAFLGALKPSTAVPLSRLPEDDDGRTLDEILEGLEKELILRAYGKAKGVKTETARTLGIKTSALYYKLAKYGIE
jgi:two-component system response regulator HydG